MKHLLSFFIGVEVIAYGEQKKKLLFAAVFASDGKAIQSLYFGALFHIIKKDLAIVGYLKQNKKKKKLE